MPIFTKNNININYDIIGNGEPLLLIGGLTTDKKVWSEMLPFLESSFQLILPDNRGAGCSTQGNLDFNISDMANDMVDLLDHLNITNIAVVGHSMGGMILQDICIRFPQRIKKAIIAGAAAKIPYHISLHLDSTIRLNQESVSLDTTLATVFPWIYAETFLLNQNKVKIEIDKIKTNKYPQSSIGYISQIKAIKKYDSRNNLKKIICPTLLIAGSDDILITPEIIHKQLYENIKLAEFKILSNCGHMFHKEQPKEFASLINDFL